MKFFLSFIAFITVGSLHSQEFDCTNFADKSKIPSPDSYRVEHVPGAVEAKNLPPRKLSCDELSIVHAKRKPDEDVVVVLDNYTQVIIFKSK